MHAPVSCSLTLKFVTWHVPWLANAPRSCLLAYQKIFGTEISEYLNAEILHLFM